MRTGKHLLTNINAIRAHNNPEKNQRKADCDMSETEYTSFNKRLAFHTAPTLLGIKCASLMSLPAAEFELETHLNIFNRRAAQRGLKIRPIYNCGCRTLILVYSEKKLRKRLTSPDASEILSPLGYDVNGSTERMIDRLSERIGESSSFPHEIGIFLDYPPEDVRGFIENHGCNYKLCGCWKVYGSEERARRTFENYERCRKFLCNKLNEGADIYQALRIS